MNYWYQNSFTMHQDQWKSNAITLWCLSIVDFRQKLIQGQCGIDFNQFRGQCKKEVRNVICSLTTYILFVKKGARTYVLIVPKR